MCVIPIFLCYLFELVQVFYHNFVNELVRNLIVHVGDVFPCDLPGPAYDKYSIVAEDAEQMGYMDEVWVDAGFLGLEDSALPNFWVGLVAAAKFMI